MQIDWITVSAQLINFLILVWLLNRFLFRPVLAVMARREALIDEKLHEASNRMREADAIKLEHQAQIKSLDEKTQILLSEANSRATAEEKRLLQTAHLEIDKRRDAWLESLETEKSEINDRFRQSIASITRSVLDSLLRRITDRSLNEQMIASFIGQLDALDSAEKQKIRSDKNQITIVSAELLDSNARRSLTRAVHEEFNVDSDIDYQTDDQLIAGLKLSVGGYELDWHLNDMLTTLDGELSHVVENVDANAH